MRLVERHWIDEGTDDRRGCAAEAPGAAVAQRQGRAVGWARASTIMGTSPQADGSRAFKCYSMVAVSAGTCTNRIRAPAPPFVAGAANRAAKERPMRVTMGGAVAVGRPAAAMARAARRASDPLLHELPR
jgi:hypothetical protein